MSKHSLDTLIQERHLIHWTLANQFTDRVSIQHNEIQIDWLADGILALTPDSQTTIDLIISCGIHGNETAPIEMIEQIFNDILDQQIILSCRLLIILGNLPAMKVNKRFTEENLNRLFSGNHLASQTREGQRAREIEQWVDHFYSRDDTKRIHLDLHTAIRGSQIEKFAIYPYQSDKPWDKQQLNWLAEAGIEAVLLGHQPSGTFSYFTSASYGAMAFTVELGKAKPFGDNDHRRLRVFKLAVVRLLQNQTQWQSNIVTDDNQVFTVVDEVLRGSDDSFQLHLDDDFMNFSTLKAGYRLTTDVPEGYVIKSDDHRIVFPNKNVPKGQRVALVVEPYDLTQIQ